MTFIQLIEYQKQKHVYFYSEKDSAKFLEHVHNLPKSQHYLGGTPTFSETYSDLDEVRKSDSYFESAKEISWDEYLKLSQKAWIEFQDSLKEKQKQKED